MFSLPENECLIEDFSCAVKKRILLHGRMYIYRDHLCFMSKLFGGKTNIVFGNIAHPGVLKNARLADTHFLRSAFHEIVSIRRAMTDLINPCIHISTVHPYMRAPLFVRTLAFFCTSGALTIYLCIFFLPRPYPRHPERGAPQPCPSTLACIRSRGFR